MSSIKLQMFAAAECFADYLIYEFNNFADACARAAAPQFHIRAFGYTCNADTREYIRVSKTGWECNATTSPESDPDHITMSVFVLLDHTDVREHLHDCLRRSLTKTAEVSIQYDKYTRQHTIVVEW